ncbi:response regulator [bacterium]|nr:response regulator [bacterium]
MKHILIVDDENAILEVFRSLFSDDDYRLTLVESGQEAIRVLKEDVVDLVITDKNLPDVSGLEVLKVAKQVRPVIEVIVITGYASLDTALAAIKEGVYDYITKPFQLEEIKLTVANATEKRRLILQNQQLMKSLEEAYTQLKELLGRREHYSQKLDDVERELYRREREIQDGIALLRRAREHAHQSYDNVVPLPKKNSEEK